MKNKGLWALAVGIGFLALTKPKPKGKRNPKVWADVEVTIDETPDLTPEDPNNTIVP
ncbi:hypothetical protein [Winogradskyella sp.]|uniref:hypothetical protein n=1 Tax=Winogradskyella sp. TaxID=1883156 RepID=UPI0026294C08|nr:hypothetical protein [Winogradskyella sp.]